MKNMKKSTIDPEVKKILEDNNYDFHKISQEFFLLLDLW
jgi:hypothetical protein